MEPKPPSGDVTHTSTACVTMVALGEDAQLRRDNRLREPDEIRRGRDGS